MEAQKATDLRRLLAEVEANERSLRLRQDELEAHLAGAPAASWREEAAEKARYVQGLYAATLTAEDTRRRTLVREAVLEDLGRLANAPPSGPDRGAGRGSATTCSVAIFAFTAPPSLLEVAFARRFTGDGPYRVPV